MINFDDCPHCKIPWPRYGTKYCSSCGLVKYDSTLIGKDISHNNKSAGTLYWFTNRQFCKFFPINTFHDTSPLPWLPFDVTHDQLLLYLTFS